MSISSPGARLALAAAVGLGALIATLSALFSWLRARTPLRELSPDELADRLRARDVFVVDVRTDWEFRRGHVRGAVSAPLGTVLEKLDLIPRDRDVVLICQTAHRSILAARTLADRGYDRLYHLSGGMRYWRGPTESDSAEA